MRRVSGSPSQSAARAAPKNGLVALRIASVDTVRCCAAYENSANGSAEFTAPTTANARQWRDRSGKPRWAPATASRITAASATRTNDSATGPRAGTATRMNTKEPPHSAPSSTSNAAERVDIGAAAAGRQRRAAGRQAVARPGPADAAATFPLARRSRSSSFRLRASPPP